MVADRYPIPIRHAARHIWATPRPAAMRQASTQATAAVTPVAVAKSTPVQRRGRRLKKPMRGYPA